LYFVHLFTTTTTYTSIRRYALHI